MNETPTLRLLPLLAMTLLAPLDATVCAAPAPAEPPGATRSVRDPGTNPLRAADEATRRDVRTEAWHTYQRSCRPCHGSVGSGDGPYAGVLETRAADLRRPGNVAADEYRHEGRQVRQVIVSVIGIVQKIDVTGLDPSLEGVAHGLDRPRDRTDVDRHLSARRLG